MTDFHIAELNVGHLKHDINDPRVADFVNNLNRVNAAAERSEGFIWRMQDEAGSSVSMSVSEDPLIIPNLSVWEDVASLEQFVFQTVHKRFYTRRAEWFDVMEKMHFVMWPVAVGHQPSLAEAWQRLEYLNKHGSSDHAFGWKHVKSANLWRSAQCSGSAA
jgi:Domain of unknown function (DUF3291)